MSCLVWGLNKYSKYYLQYSFSEIRSQTFSWQFSMIGLTSPKYFSKKTLKTLNIKWLEAKLINFMFRYKSSRPEPATLLKKRPWRWWILQNFWGHLFLQNTSGDFADTEPTQAQNHILKKQNRILKKEYWYSLMRALQLTMTSSITVAVGSRYSLKYVL